MRLGGIGLRLLLKSGVLGVLMAGTALAFTGAEYLPQAKMTPVQARQIALKAYPGKIISEELEKEVLQLSKR